MDAAVPAASAAYLEEPKLTARYWASFVLIVSLLVCEIFDFFVVGFIVSAVAPKWGLTYGQSTVILLAAGLGSIFGAIGFGWAADRLGRKFAIVGGAIVCSLSAGAIALIPERAWLLFALLRFIVGVGYGGAGSSQFALIVELTPTRLRTVMTSSMGVPAGLGVVAASASVAVLFHLLGWRGVAALCVAPAALALIIAFLVPESARWRAIAARSDKSPSAKGRLREALADPRRFWLIVLIQLGMGACLSGVLLWGPTITGQLLQVPPQQAAAWFTWVTAAGLAGRVLFIFLPLKLGRVGAGMLMGYGGGACLVLAALFHDAFLGAAPAFLVLLALGELLYDGGFSNVNPYAPELYPVRTAALGTGVASAAGGAGKILGPVALGLIAGADNLISPKATEHAVLPAFLFLGVCCVLAGAAYHFLGVETHGRPLRD
jgi:MFS transporter, putative metabolite:H+ symporter